MSVKNHVHEYSEELSLDSQNLATAQMPIKSATHQFWYFPTMNCVAMKKNTPMPHAKTKINLTDVMMGKKPDTKEYIL